MASSKPLANEEFFINLKQTLKDDCYELKKSTGCHQLAEFLQSVEKNTVAAAALYRENCFDKGITSSCFNLGMLHLVGEGVEKDAKIAYDLFINACSEGSVEACNNAGLIKRRGLDDVSADGPLAMSLLQKSCEGRYRNACFNLGDSYRRGIGTEVNMSLALEYSIKACHLGHTYGCVNASRMYRLGDGVAKDDALADHFKSIAEDLVHGSSTQQMTWSDKRMA